MGSVSDEELIGALEEILTEADLEVTTVRSVMQQLASRFPNDDLEGKKSFIRVELVRLMDTIEERKEAKEEPEDASLEEEEEEVVEEEEAAESSGSEVVIEEIEEEAEDEEEEDVEDSPKPAKRRKLTAFEKAVVLKDPLAEALGVRVVSRCKLPRHVKAYIEKHGLEKNPKDRREYLSDDTMRKVLKTKTFSMFSINKYMAPLIIKPDECDEETQEEARAYEAKVLAALPATSNGESKAAKKRKKAKGSGGQGGKGGGLTKPMKLSEEMAFVCEADILSRTEVVKAIWVYIRKNNLKDPSDGRKIICDARLQDVFGESRVGIFEMHKYIGRHLTNL
ncbi:hypothetical protein NDN08_000182 [Rhodosorus marinus]|uniref:DM2 domain-containing protein n=1 Tax=Rhodosorus marinus TaxID=101924 RepID=A0AAV8UH73_9RHOD|nr:hypothetical protein NDN08_000182 [Rhodosorus marinus]